MASCSPVFVVIGALERSINYSVIRFPTSFGIRILLPVKNRRRDMCEIGITSLVVITFRRWHHFIKPILLLFIERWRHLADSNEPDFVKKNVFKFIKFNWVTGSPPKFDTLLAVWYRTYMQSFIISHSSCAEQYGDMCPDTHTQSAIAGCPTS